MRVLPFADTTFDVVMNLFTSFGYFETDEEHALVFREVARVLRGGGWFVLDYLNATRVTEALVEHEELTLGGRRVSIDRRLSEDGRFVFKEMNLVDNNRRFTERVRLFTPRELERLLQAAGLTVRERFGSYAGDALTSDSSRVLLFSVRS